MPLLTDSCVDLLSKLCPLLSSLIYLLIYSFTVFCCFKLSFIENQDKSPKFLLSRIFSAETSLVVLCLCDPHVGTLDLIPGWGIGSHMPKVGICMPQLKFSCASMKTEDPMCFK